MKLFLDTADKAAITTWFKTGLINGITTNPTHLSQTGGDPKKIIKELCALLVGNDVSVEVTEHEPDSVYKQAKTIAALADNVVVKIPCHKNYYSVINQLVSEDVKINVTLVFTVPQALFMCKLGVTYISPFIGRWDDIGVDGSSYIFSIRQMIDEYGFETQLLAASIRHVRHLHDAILAGADVATVPAAVLEKATRHPLTDDGIEKFDADWKKLGVKQFP